MKKLLLLLITQTFFGQIQKNVGDFNKVTTFDKIDVVLIQSEENKVVLDGADADIVEVINKNGELKIRMPMTKLLTGDNITATVYYNNINAIEANEGSRISSNNDIEAPYFEVILKEGSQVQIGLETKKLTLRVGSGCIATISGKGDNQDITTNSGGSYNGKNFETEQTTITVNAGGVSAVFATEFVDAKVRAGGTINVFGNPKTVNKKTMLGGKIINY